MVSNLCFRKEKYNQFSFDILRNSKFFKNMKPTSLFTITNQEERKLKSSCDFY